jgi:hypothetical protein
MPDLITHLASGYVLALPFWKRTQCRILFFVGTVLPDLATRPLNILVPSSGRFTEPLHTPLGYAFLCWLLAQLFDTRRARNDAFYALLGGGCLHFLLDALQRHVAGGYIWLFPFSTASYSWGLFWPDECMRWMPVWAIVTVVIEITARRRSRGTR